MNIIHSDIREIWAQRYNVAITLGSLFDRWDMEKWLAEMTPNAEVITDSLTSSLRDNEIAIYCDAKDAARIKLLL